MFHLSLNLPHLVHAAGQHLQMALKLYSLDLNPFYRYCSDRRTIFATTIPNTPWGNSSGNPNVLMGLNTFTAASGSIALPSSSPLGERRPNIRLAQLLLETFLLVRSRLPDELQH